MSELLLPQWSVRAVGKRPNDWMVRDVLFGSLIRDHRAFEFQRLCRHPPEGFPAAVHHLPAKGRRHAINTLVLNALYQRWYTTLRESDCRSSIVDPGVRKSLIATITRMARCPPMGVLVRLPQGTAAKRQCRHQLCPWCHARRVVSLYADLKPYSPPDGVLIQLTVEFPDSILDPERVKEWCCRYRPGDADTSDFRKHILYAKAEVGKQLEDFARLLKANVGLSTYQTSSHFDQADGNGYRHRLGVLAVRQCSSGKDTDKFMSRLSGRRSGLDSVQILGRHWPLDFIATAPANHTTLRYLLAGSSTAFRCRDEMATNIIDSAERCLPDGIPGILSLQPSYMFLEHQFHELELASHAVRTYVRSGIWRSGSSRVPLVGTRSQLRSQSGEAKASDLERSPEQARRIRQHGRRQSLLHAVQQHWPTIKERATSGPGRPAYRRELRRLLQVNGIECSERDARWILEQMNIRKTPNVRR